MFDVRSACTKAYNPLNACCVTLLLPKGTGLTFSLLNFPHSRLRGMTLQCRAWTPCQWLACGQVWSQALQQSGTFAQLTSQNTYSSRVFGCTAVHRVNHETKKQVNVKWSTKLIHITPSILQEAHCLLHLGEQPSHASRIFVLSPLYLLLGSRVLDGVRSTEQRVCRMQDCGSLCPPINSLEFRVSSVTGRPADKNTVPHLIDRRGTWGRRYTVSETLLSSYFLTKDDASWAYVHMVL